MIHVISTTGNPPPDAKAKCIASVVGAQEGVNVVHRYLEPPPRTDGFPHFPALIEHITKLPDDAIVVSLDGDDWLLPGALERVQQAHDEGALVTYGSFRYADGRPGFAAPVQGPIRRAPWTATHLKTFRAGLFRRIKREHLQTPEGLWLEHARDMAIMFPMVEMAGPRAVFIPDVLYVYNAANSAEFRLGVPEIAAEREAAARLRALPPYGVL